MIFATVHEPPDGAVDRVDRAEQLAFIGDRFSLAAAVFGSFWLMAKGLWLGLLIYALAALAIVVVVLLAGLGPAWLLVLGLALNLILGLEASSLRRWTLERRGWRTLGTVAGRTIDECERRFLGSWLADQPRADHLAVAARASNLTAMADGEAGDALGRKPPRRWLPWSARR